MNSNRVLHVHTIVPNTKNFIFLSKVLWALSCLCTDDDCVWTGWDVEILFLFLVAIKSWIMSKNKAWKGVNLRLIRVLFISSKILSEMLLSIASPLTAYCNRLWCRTCLVIICRKNLLNSITSLLVAIILRTRIRCLCKCDCSFLQCTTAQAGLVLSAFSMSSKSN